jgi:hypothetical protein
MDWCRLGTGYYRDPALVRAGEAAEVLFLRCLAYSGEQESRGRIPKNAIPMLTPSRTQLRLKALIQEDLLVEDGNDVLIRSWEEWQEALDSESERRRKAREKKARQRAAEREQEDMSPTVSPGQSPGQSPLESQGRPRHIEVEVEEEKNMSAVADPPRTDVEGLCRYFADAIAKNGVKATITKRWRTEARLLLDKDERDRQEIRAVIDWCTQDAFWKANILSVPKLREKYHQLRLAMERARPHALSADPHQEHLEQWR